MFKKSKIKKIFVTCKRPGHSDCDRSVQPDYALATHIMKVLQFEGSDDLPGVVLDREKGLFEISGRSLPEDSSAFFEPVIDWIREYKKEPNATTNFIFKMEYFNTASSKYIQDLITELEGIPNIHIVWCYLEDDETMEETGQEFAELFTIPFEFRTY